MNLETCLESYFSSFQNQAFGPQNVETLVNRGVIKSHVREDVNLFYRNMRQLSILLKHGVPQFQIPQFCLPIIVHSQHTDPTALRKYMSSTKCTIYNQAVENPDFADSEC